MSHMNSLALWVRHRIIKTLQGLVLLHSQLIKENCDTVTVDYELRQGQTQEILNIQNFLIYYSNQCHCSYFCFT